MNFNDQHAALNETKSRAAKISHVEYLQVFVKWNKSLEQKAGRKPASHWFIDINAAIKGNRNKAKSNILLDFVEISIFEYGTWCCALWQYCTIQTLAIETSFCVCPFGIFNQRHRNINRLTSRKAHFNGFYFELSTTTRVGKKASSIECLFVFHLFAWCVLRLCRTELFILQWQKMALAQCTLIVLKAPEICHKFVNACIIHSPDWKHLHWLSLRVRNFIALRLKKEEKQLPASSSERIKNLFSAESKRIKCDICKLQCLVAY